MVGCRRAGDGRRRASRPRTSSATRSAGTSRCSSRRADAPGRWSRWRRPAAGRSDDRSVADTFHFFAQMQELLRGSAPARGVHRLLAGGAARRARGDRRAPRARPARDGRPDHPGRSRVHRCAADARVRRARDSGRSTRSGSTCPVRMVWGTADKLLPWPTAAARYRTEWLPHADWVELDDVGHCPQVDVPLETAELILGLRAHRVVDLRRGRAASTIAACTAWASNSSSTRPSSSSPVVSASRPAARCASPVIASHQRALAAPDRGEPLAHLRPRRGEGPELDQHRERLAIGGHQHRVVGGHRLELALDALLEQRHHEVVAAGEVRVHGAARVARGLRRPPRRSARPARARHAAARRRPATGPASAPAAPHG